MKRSVTVVMLCVAVASCSSSGSSPGGPSPTPSSRAVADLPAAAALLAGQDGRPAQESRYLSALTTLDRRCRAATPTSVASLVDTMQVRLRDGKVGSLRLVDAKALAAIVTKPRTDCRGLLTSYLSEVAGTAPPRTAVGWGGYAGSEWAFAAAHHPDPARAGSFLPRLANGDDRYQVLSSTEIFERFDPPVSAVFALDAVTRDLLPAPVHVVYRLSTGQCQQEIYLGSTLGRLTGDPSVGAFVELTSGGGVGAAHYDPLRVDRVRITPGGAIGGQPCE